MKLETKFKLVFEALKEAKVNKIDLEGFYYAINEAIIKRPFTNQRQKLKDDFIYEYSSFCLFESEEFEEYQERLMNGSY